MELESVGKLGARLQFSFGLGLLHSVYKSLTLIGMNLAGINGAQGDRVPGGT